MSNFNLKRWRKVRAEARALALGTSSEDEENASVISSQEKNSSGNERGEHACNSEEANEPCTDESTTETDSSDESDFGFVEEVDTSDSEQDIGHVSDTEEPSLSLKEKIVDWSTKNNLTRSCLDELLVVLKSEGLQVPKDARTLLQTPKTVSSEENVVDSIFIME
ncbi:unnamed protein product [Mytilus coruscus]|uniref:Uncharacterized protein n=1 Tax=Mytilus coruscus TaxID=42192 RepID=A0A6J8E7Y4_MYTCO|nr:unnamed protein product [Mytilus coruscus]